LGCGHFDLSVTPDGTQMPQVAQFGATVAMAVAGRRLRRVRAARDRSIAIGDASVASQRGGDFVLQRTDRRCARTGVAPGRRSVDALDTFTRIPLWGLGIYIVFFGGMPYLILQNPRHRRTADFGNWQLQLLRRRAVADRRLSGVFDRHQRGGTAGPCRVAAGCGRRPHRLACGVCALSSDGVDAAGSVAVGWPIFSAHSMPRLPRRCDGWPRH
jgi:hypothetical protein